MKRSLVTESSCVEEDELNIESEQENEPVMQLRRRSVARIPDKIDDIDKDDMLSSPTQEQYPMSTNAYLFAACAAWNSCILGYDFGVNALSVILVQKSLELTDVQISAYLGALDLFAMLGAATVSTVNDRYGRRGCFMMTSIGFLLGDLLQSCASSFEQLMIGRSVLGLSIGWGLSIDPMYISEISPAHIRGYLVTWSEIAINVGVIFGFASGITFYHTPDDYAWRYMYGSGAILPLTMLLLVKFYMPESPRWLLQNNNDDEARLVLSKLYPNDEDVETIIHDVKKANDREAATFQPDWKFLLCNPSPAYRRMLIAGIVAGVSQQVVGISAIGSFQTFVLDQSGVKDRYYQALTLVGIQSIKTLVTFGSSRFLDSVGRRKLSFISIAGIIVSLLIMAFDFHLSSGATSTAAILGLLGYMVSFAIGMGPVAWLVPAEVFSTSVRAKGMSVSTFCNRVVSTILSSSFLLLEKTITWSGAFMVLVLLSTIMAILIHLFVPETKGRSLEEMAEYFANLTGDRSVLDHLKTDRIILCADSIVSNSQSNQKSVTSLSPEII